MRELEFPRSRLELSLTGHYGLPYLHQSMAPRGLNLGAENSLGKVVSNLGCRTISDYSLPYSVQHPLTLIDIYVMCNSVHVLGALLLP